MSDVWCVRDSNSGLLKCEVDKGSRTKITAGWLEYNEVLILICLMARHHERDTMANGTQR